MTGVSNVRPHFDNVPRSMFTIYRCSFKTCPRGPSGRPLIEEILESFPLAFGIMFSCVYFFYIVFFQVGLLNIVKAIYINRTMEYDQKSRNSQLRERLENKELFDSLAAFIMKQVLSSIDAHFEVAQALTDDIDHIMELEIPRKVIDATIKNDASVRKALDALDIDPEDQKKLSRIADSASKGHVGVMQFITTL